MSSYLSSWKWPSLSFRSTAPIPDAPLGSLSSDEQEKLDELTGLALPMFASPPQPLVEADAWSSLHRDEEREFLQEILLRLLRYNVHSIAKSAKQLNSTLQWRASSQVALLPESAMHGLANGFPISLLDVKGHKGERLILTLSEHYMKKDVDHKVQLVGVGKMFDHMMYDRNGPRIKHCHLVIDYTGLSMKQVDIFAMKNGIPIYLNHFPDVFDKIICINYPKFIYGVWKIIYPLLDERTANRVIWLADGEALHKELEATFPRDEIPYWLMGGSASKDGKKEEVELLNGIKIDADTLKERFA